MIEVYTDGATDGEGWSGIGIVMKQNKKVHEFSFPIGQTHSNHEAEFAALVQALTLCKELFPDEVVSVRTDSKVVVDTVEKEYTKNRMFQPYIEEIQKLFLGFPHVFIKWIPQQTNTHADRLAKKAIYQNEQR